MWQNINVNCSHRCTNDKLKYDATTKEPSVCLKCSYPVENHAPQTFALSQSRSHEMYNIKRFVKVNQLYIFTKCYGKLVRGTKKMDEEDSQKNQDLSLVFTDLNVHHWTESTAWNDNDKFSLDISGSYGTESDDVTLNDSAMYFLLNEKWVKWTEASEDDAGVKIEKDSGVLNRIGRYGGGLCECPSKTGDNSLKYRVGALAINSTDTEKFDFSFSCINSGGVIKEKYAVATEDDPKYLGLVVRCNVNDFGQIDFAENNKSIIDHCKNRVELVDNIENVDDIEGEEENAHVEKKIENCVKDVLEQRSKFSSQEWTHLSFQRWHEYKKLHR